MIRRHRAAALLTVAALCGFGAAATSATAQQHSPQPAARAMQQKLAVAAVRAKAADNASGRAVDDDEAESVKLRGDYQQSITAAPAVAAPAGGLIAAQQAGARCPPRPAAGRRSRTSPSSTTRSTAAQNYGVGWGDVTGRMTALTHSGSTVFAASASGGVWRSTDQGTTLGVRQRRHATSRGRCHRDRPVGRLGLGRHGRGEQRLGEPVRRRGLPAGQRQQHLAAGGRRRAQRRRVRTGCAGSTATSTSPRATGCTGGPSARPSPALAGRAAARRATAATRRRSSVTDLIAVPGTGGRKILAVVGWAGYSAPPATVTTASTSAPARRGSFARVTPTGDIDPTDIGRTTFSAVGGWLYAVVQDTANDALRGEGVFVSHVGQPGRTVDPHRRHRQAPQLRFRARRLEQRLLPGHPVRLQPVHPRRPEQPQARLPRARGGLRVRPTAADMAHRRSVLELRHQLRRGRHHAVQLPADHAP